MLTDDQARDLLRQAAETIEVGPARPVEPVRRRRGLLVALAAAAAVAVAAGTTVVLTRSDDGPGPATAPSISPAPEQSEAGPDDGSAPEIEEGSIPVVFGYDEGTALRLLDEAGANRVSVEAARGCLRPGRALRTEPAAGAPLTSTTPVRLVVTVDVPNTDCLGTDGLFWPLLDFARDGRPPLDAAPAVTSAVDGEVVTVTDPEDRAAWPRGSALDALADLPRLTEREPGEPAMLFGFQPDDGSGSTGCSGASAARDPGLPEGLAGRPSTAVWVRHQDAGELGPCVVVNIFDRDETVDAVVVRHLTWQAPAD